MRQNIATTSETLRQLRVEEATLQGKVSDINFQITQLKSGEVQARVNALKESMVQKEAAAAELQKSMDRALEEKLKIQEEIEKLNKMGDAAGKKQISINAPASRYEPTAPRVVTGVSQDPLNQTPVPVSETFRKIKGADGPAPTTDTLGLGPKSPFVNDEDFKVGVRPEPGTPSARFGEWHRPGSKISQPPGGASSNIFGPAEPVAPKVVVQASPARPSTPPSSQSGNWARSSSKVTQPPGGASSNIFG